jgi:hypothetical protein
MTEPIKQLLVALLLIGAGLISPSNGVDDKIECDLFPMLTETAIIMILAIGVLLIFKRFSQENKL